MNNSEKKLIGRFYFKRTTSGNLIGEFSNNLTFSNYTESADLIETKGEFIGKYHSSWQVDGNSFSAQLDIRMKPMSTNILLLEWVGAGFQYWGEGFISDGILIGDYRDFEIQ